MCGSWWLPGFQPWVEGVRTFPAHSTPRPGGPGQMSEQNPGNYFFLSVLGGSACLCLTAGWIDTDVTSPWMKESLSMKLAKEYIILQCGKPRKKSIIK